MAQGWVAAKLNPAGEVLWVTHFGGQGEVWYGGLAIDDEDNLYAAGEAGDVSERSDALLVKLSSDGDVLWQRRYAAPFVGEPDERPNQWFRQCCIDEQGNLFAIGRRYDPEDSGWVALIHEYSLDGELRAEYEYGGIESASEAVTAPGGGLYLACRKELKPALVRLDEDLDIVWARRWTGDEVGALFGLTVDAAGNPFIAVDYNPGAESGTSLGSAIIRLDQGGSVQWSRIIAAENTLDIRDIVLLADGTLRLGGESYAIYGCLEYPDHEHRAEMPLLISLDADGGWQSGWRLELIDELPTEDQWQMMYFGGGADWGYLADLLAGSDGALYGLGRATTAHCQWTYLDGLSESVDLPGESFALTRQEQTSMLIAEPAEHRAGQLAAASEGSDVLLVTRLR